MSNSTNNVITSASSASNNSALKADDRIRSTLAGRTGVVVRTYDDGSAAVLWDEGEPQPEGLVHERMPRCMLEFQDTREIAAKNEPVASLPPSASPILGAEPATKAGDPEQYPAVYTLLPGEFKGMPVSLICHEGRAWLIAEEIAAVLGDSPKAVAEIEEIISYHFAGQGFPEGSYTKARLASTTLVMRLLDQRAIRYLGVTMDGDMALDLAEWISADHMPVGEPATPVPIASAKPEPTLQECMDQLKGVHYDIFKALRLVEAQVRGLGNIVGNLNTRDDDVANIAPLAEIAVSLVRPFDDLMERQDDIIFSLKQRLFRNPAPGAMLPESVWLDLVAELAAERGEYSNENMSHLADIADSLTKYGKDSPEVTAARRLVETFVRQHGAYLYDHEESGRVAFAWDNGMAPHERRKAQETAPVH